MRARGAQVTDIAVLVVAADDGVKPQTIEALNHAQAADVPIVVAVNKIDKEGADPAKVRGQLTEYGLVAEEYGGDTMFVDVSARSGTGIDELLEAIVLTADAALDLRANPDQDAQGVAIEAHLDRGRGPVGDRAGPARHAARRRLDRRRRGVRPRPRHARRERRDRRRGAAVASGHGARPDRASPAPATTSWSSPRTGSPGRSPSAARPASATPSSPSARPRVTLEDLESGAEAGEREELYLILKGDVSGSVEALEDALLKLDVGEEVALRVIDRGVGAITENDVNLAMASDAVIIGFNVRPEGGRASWPSARASTSATTRSSTRRSRRSRRRSRACSSRSSRRSQLGTAEIREVFRSRSSATSPAASSAPGTISRNTKARLIRDGVVVAENLTIDSLRRFKDDATEVREGFECGIGLGYNDIKVDDVDRDVRDAREAARLTGRARPGPAEAPGQAPCTSGR